MSTNKNKFNKKFGFDKDKSQSKASLSSLTGISRKDIDEIFNRGIGAFRTNPSSVRSNVKSEEQWAYGRVYAFIMKTYNGIKNNKKKINQDNQLYLKYKKKGLK